MTNIIDILRMAKAKHSFRRIARSPVSIETRIRNYLRLAPPRVFIDTTSDDWLAENAAAVIRAVYREKLERVLRTFELFSGVC